MQKPPMNTHEFQSLVEVVTALRGPDGCPWDKEQTHKTLTQYAIEEVHELAESIDKEDLPGTIEELGDVLLQVVLHSEIGRQEGRFTLTDVISGITNKMIDRHPHVFGDVKVKDSAHVLNNWAKIKEKEKPKQDPFASIPESIPALIRSQKIGAKSVRYNFDWENSSQVIEKVDEELQELKEAIATGTKNEQQEELGDLLFSIVQLARHLDFDAEQSLRMANKKFETRFGKMRALVEKDQKDFSNLSVKELENYWTQAKKGTWLPF